MTEDRVRSQVPGVRFLPNAITVLALCSGLSAFYFADRAHNGALPWLVAIGAIGAAGILDSLDGPAARLLKASSRIGAELDSLSDLVSFGVAPALVIYMWTFTDGRGVGWIFCLVFAVCVALRLARFNSLLDAEPRPWAKSFFTGVPAPAAGLLALIPLVMSTRFPNAGFWQNDWLVGAWLIIVGLLAVSRIPTIALKSVRVSNSLVVPLLILLVAAVAATFFEPEIMLALGLLVYLLHLPYAGYRYLYLKNHPELWDVGRRSGRSGRSTRMRLRVRMPQRRRVAGRSLDGSPLSSRRGAARRRENLRRRLR